MRNWLNLYPVAVVLFGVAIAVLADRLKSRRLVERMRRKIWPKD